MEPVPLELVTDEDGVVRRIFRHKLRQGLRRVVFERHLFDLSIEVLHREVRVTPQMSFNGALHGSLGFQRA